MKAPVTVTGIEEGTSTITHTGPSKVYNCSVGNRRRTAHTSRSTTQIRHSESGDPANVSSASRKPSETSQPRMSPGASQLDCRWGSSAMKAWVSRYVRTPGGLAAR